ncbi:right-handed parallel beta-helix repeat-containing protein [Sorangium sp. So ce131]|uniref:right-handed parallel beta-helix repeat-containing protein n=1 Tax=Sorangium sp. So ce131 TaxID=3133282 RepID=UPI003F60E9DA
MNSNTKGFGSQSFTIGMRAASLLALSAVGFACAPLDADVAAEELDAEEQAAGATYQVGPTRSIKTLGELAGRLAPGDVVEVDGNATYAGNIRLTKSGTATSKITIRGVKVNGKRPLLQGGTNTIELNANYIVFEGFEVTGGSSRCIFHHGHEVTIADTVVRDCPAHGILGADGDSGSLTLDHVEVYKCGAGTTKHPIYIGMDQTKYPNGVFRMQHSYVHDANGGNAVKSRASRNEIYYNWIEGGLYKELELIGADGQDPGLVREDSDVVGNVFRKTHTQFVVRVGGDGTGETNGRYRFVNNTFLLMQGSSAAIHLFDGIESIELHNNIFHRVGGGSVQVFRDDASWATGSALIKGVNNAVPTGTTVPTGFTGTKIVSDPGFTNVGARDVTLLASSPLRNVGVSATSGISGHPVATPLALPLYHPPRGALAPAGVAQRRPTEGGVDLGAFEYSTTSTTTAEPTDSAVPTEPAEETAEPGEESAECPVVGAGEWSNTSLAAQQGAFTVSWDVTPSASRIDGAIGLSSGAADAWTKLAAIVLFDNQGYVRARNGAKYTSDATFAYTGGATYKVRMVVDVAAKRYSAYIQPAGGGEVQIASNYAFRAEQAQVGQLDNWALAQAVDGATLSACDASIQQ